MIPVFRPSYDEQEVQAVREVMESGWTGLGPKVEQFEREFARYIGTKYAVATNSGTSALELAIAVSKRDNSPVITTPLTFISTNHSILRNGLKPIWADVDRHWLNIDPDSIDIHSLKQSQALICVHYGGFACEMDRLRDMADSYDVVLIEDAAHACGGEYHGTKLGSLGDLGCFSFHAVKNLSCGDGGMVVTDSELYYERLLTMRWCGIDKTTWQRTNSHYAWDYDVPVVGAKYHMNDITAAIGLVQLSKLDQQNERRRILAKRYENELCSGHHAIAPMIEYPVERNGKSSWHNFVVKHDKRDALHDHLKVDGVASSVHYRPSNHYPPYAGITGGTPVADWVWRRILTIPLYPDMTMDEQDIVINSIKTFTKGTANG